MYLGNFFKHNLQYRATNSIFKTSVLLLENIKLYTCCAEKSFVDLSESLAQIKTTDVS